MGKLSRSMRRKTMPVSAGAGTKRTKPCTPVWRPTPSTQDSLAIVVWNIPHVYCSILLASLCQRCALLSTGYKLCFIVGGLPVVITQQSRSSAWRFWQRGLQECFFDRLPFCLLARPNLWRCYTKDSHFEVTRTGA